MALQLADPQQPQPPPPTEPTPLYCSLEDRGSNVAWVVAVRELSAATAQQLKQTLSRAERHAWMVVLDLRGLTVADHSGVEVVVSAGIRARQAGRRLILVRGPVQVDRLFASAYGGERLDVVDLDLGVPAVQALLVLAREDQAA